jgi:ABC-type Mn2+/Zn2+ transport system permease subunit
MRVLEGDKAVTRGRRMAIIASVLIVVGLVGGLYIPYKLGSTYGPQIRLTTPEVSSRK